MEMIMEKGGLKKKWNRESLSHGNSENRAKTVQDKN